MHEPRVGLAVVHSLFESVEGEIRARALNGRLCPSQLRRMGRRAARRISMVDESLLREPADRGVRLVALSLLADAQKAGDRLTSASRGLYDGTAESDDALHDFRVAVRRLRSWIRAFKPWLRGAVPRKRRRRLSEMADATAATRDATVHLAWMHEEDAALDAQQRVGHAWLSERLETQRKDGADAALSAARDMVAMVAKLTRRLDSYRVAVLAHEHPARFGAILAQRLLKESESLQGDLATIHRATDVDESHRARISAKRLRYLAEPVAKLAGDGDAIIETLKTLQDSLGDLHDVNVFSKQVVGAAEEAALLQASPVSEIVLGVENGDDRVRQPRSGDPGPGLLRLTLRLHERGTRAFAGIYREWLNDAGASFFNRVRDFAAEIARSASAGTEIERKYLLERLPEKTLDAPSVEIEQGYLPGKKLIERIRRVHSPDGVERWFRTVKIGSGIERLELEEEAGAGLCRVMWRLTKGRRVHKRRYSIRDVGDALWEVDEYLDRTLVVAEIELPSPDTVVELPPWLRAVMDREVTDEPEYANDHLAR
jgi:CHAD domain-containing protein/CYTH domain-containing protein